MSKASTFLEKCFKRLSQQDFEQDSTLKGFYQAYKAEIETTIKKKLEEYPNDRQKAIDMCVFISIDKYYFEYLLRNSPSSPEEKKKEIDDIQNNIIIAVLNPTKSEEKEDNPVFDETLRQEKMVEKKVSKMSEDDYQKKIQQFDKTNHIQVEENTTEVKNDKTAIAHNLLSQPVVNLDKKQLLSVLSECISNSLLTTADVEDKLDPNTDHDILRINEASVMTKLILADNRVIPEPQKDIDFNRRNELINIWITCEQYFEEIRIKNPGNYNALSKIFLIDINTLKSPVHGNLPIYEIETTEYKEYEIPAEKLYSKPLKCYTGSPGLVSYRSNDVLLDCVRTPTNRPYLYVVSEMQFNLGGNAEQGFDSPITPYYLSSTASIAMAKMAPIYPLEYNNLFYLPFTIYVRDHTDPNYRKIDDLKYVPMKAIVFAPPYRPKTNLVDQDMSMYDKRLLDPMTEFKHPEKFVKQLIGMFNTALFFGHSRLIIDDLGAMINWLPIHHAYRLLGAVINNYRLYFQEIIVKKPKDFDIK